jgi:uncharacterized protein
MSNPPPHIAQMMELARAGHTLPQHFVGTFYAAGRDLPYDMGEAARWWRKSADHGYPEAQFSLGTLYLSGNGVVKDLGTAAQWFQKAAEQRHPGAQFGLGVLHLTPGALREASTAEGAKWIRAAAQGNHLPAQFSLGSLLFIGMHVPKDSTAGVTWMRKAAEKKHVQAQLKLGLAYQEGNGVSKDPVEAARWIRKAAENGIPLAMGILAGLLYEGTGVAADQAESLKWRVIAAECGDQIARETLRTMGLPIPEEAPRHSISPEQTHMTTPWPSDPPIFEPSLHGLKRLADSGIAAAQFALGEQCLQGGFGRPDRPKAMEWFRRAAAKGHFDAQVKVAVMLDQDVGSTSLDEAIGKFFDFAVSGNMEACRILAQRLAMVLPNQQMGSQLLQMAIATTLPDEAFFHKAVCRLCLGYQTKSGAFKP